MHSILFFFYENYKVKSYIIYQMNHPWEREFWNTAGKTNSENGEFAKVDK